MFNNVQLARPLIENTRFLRQLDSTSETFARRGLEGSDGDFLFFFPTGFKRRAKLFTIFAEFP